MNALTSPDDHSAAGRIRVAYLVSHPIQYQAPLLRRIAQEPDIELTVFFASDFSLKSYKDVGFGVGVEWGISLLAGYESEFLPKLRDLGRTGPATQINYGILSRLRGRAGRPGYDVLWIHGYSTVNAWQGMLAAKALGIPVLLRAEPWLASKQRGGLRLFTKAMFFRVVCWLVDGVLPIGTHNAAYWRFYFGEAMPQFLMPYAVDNAYFRQRAAESLGRRGELRAELGMDEGRPVILFASKLQTRKRCVDLIAAYSRFCATLQNGPQPYLVIVGDGEERASLEMQAAASGLTGIRFAGFKDQQEMPRYLDLADVFVLPSQAEPWGLVVNEAMNARCAVIVSDEVGCQPDLVTHGVEGYVFKAGDVQGLTVCLRSALETRERTEGMGRQAEERVSGWDFEADVRGLRMALGSVTRRMEA